MSDNEVKELIILIPFIYDEYNGHMNNNFCEKKCKLITNIHTKDESTAVMYLNTVMYQGYNYINIKLYIKLYIVLHYFVNKFTKDKELKDIYALKQVKNTNNITSSFKINKLLYEIDKTISNIKIFYKPSTKTTSDDKIFFENYCKNMKDLLLEKIYLLHSLVYNLLYIYLSNATDNKIHENNIIRSILSFNSNTSSDQNMKHFYDFFNTYIDKIAFNYITYNTKSVTILNPNNKSNKQIISKLVPNTIIGNEKQKYIEKLKKKIIYVYEDDSLIDDQNIKEEFWNNTKINKDLLYS